jgi:hypothetical protein
MRVLLLHLDGKLPNVALMRLSAHHKARGDEVTLRRAGPRWRRSVIRGDLRNVGSSRLPERVLASRYLALRAHEIDLRIEFNRVRSAA